jgi:hypothetical protein
MVQQYKMRKYTETHITMIPFLSVSKKTYAKNKHAA